MQTIARNIKKLCLCAANTVENVKNTVFSHTDVDAAGEEEGSVTVEYAIGAVAAAGFAGLLLVILKSGAVKNLLEGIIQQALSL